MKHLYLCIAIFSMMTFSIPGKVEAQERYLGEVFWVAFTFCPRGSSELNGQLLPISQNQALFSLLGTTYGGDGRTTFALPDLRGRVSLHNGQGPGLQDYRQGSRGGIEEKTLNVSEIPAHNHEVNITAKTEPAAKSDPSDNFLAKSGSYRSNGTNTTIKGGATNNAGGGQSFSIRSPYLTMKACIMIQGVFPSRS